MGLDDVLNDTPAAVEQTQEVVQETQVEQTQQTEQVTQQSDRGADGKFVPKQAEKVAEVPAKVEPKQEQMSERERAFLSKAQDEQRKRQELEKRLQEYESKQPKEEPKKFWDDPEAHLRQFQEQIAQTATNSRLQTAEMIARSRYADFDDNVQAFAQVLQATPGLQHQWLNAADPAEFAYRTGKNYKQLHEAGNIDTMRANIEKEIRLKVEAEFTEKQKKSEAERAAIPGSLSDARGTSSPKVVWGGPPPLDDILK